MVRCIVNLFWKLHLETNYLLFIGRLVFVRIWQPGAQIVELVHYCSFLFPNGPLTWLIVNAYVKLDFIGSVRKNLNRILQLISLSDISNALMIEFRFTHRFPQTIFDLVILFNSVAELSFRTKSEKFNEAYESKDRVLMLVRSLKRHWVCII